MPRGQGFLRCTKYGIKFEAPYSLELLGEAGGESLRLVLRFAARLGCSVEHSITTDIVSV
jgi:hypothetical protein